MKSDVDRLMREDHLEALLISGPVAYNPNKAYFTGLVHVTSGYLLKQVGKSPVLFYRSMERDEAARTGLETKSLDDYRPTELIEQSKGDHIQAAALMLREIFSDYEVSGRVALYGKVELGSGLAYSIGSGKAWMESSWLVSPRTTLYYLEPVRRRTNRKWNASGRWERSLPPL